jgi:hypothetical protein
MTKSFLDRYSGQTLQQLIAMKLDPRCRHIALVARDRNGPVENRGEVAAQAPKKIDARGLVRDFMGEVAMNLSDGRNAICCELKMVTICTRTG